MLHKKDLFMGVYSPNRRLVEFQIEMKNVKGALAETSTELARLGVNLCSGFVTAYPEKPTALFSFIADITEAHIDPERLTEEVSKLNVVSQVKIHEANIEGLIVDEVHFPVLAIDERCIILTVRTISAMFHQLREMFGPPASSVLYHMGLVAGTSKVEAIRDKYGLTGKNVLDVFLSGRVAKGWGMPEILEFDETRATGKIRVHDLFECLRIDGKMTQVGSHFFRGYLEGLLSNVFGQPTLVKEEECMTKGHEYCTFIFQPRQ